MCCLSLLDVAFLAVVCPRTLVCVALVCASCHRMLLYQVSARSCWGCGYDHTCCVVLWVLLLAQPLKNSSETLTFLNALTEDVVGVYVRFSSMAQLAPDMLSRIAQALESTKFMSLWCHGDVTGARTAIANVNSKAKPNQPRRVHVVAPTNTSHFNVRAACVVVVRWWSLSSPGLRWRVRPYGMGGTGGCLCLSSSGIVPCGVTQPAGATIRKHRRRAHELRVWACWRSAVPW